MKNQTRRNFIKKTTLGTAAVMSSGFPSSSFAFGKNIIGANDRINCAVVGVRSRGKAHVAAIHAQKNSRLIYNCDVDDQIISEHNTWCEKKMGYLPKVIKDYRRLLEEKDVDVIFRLQSASGSIAHAEALDILIEKVNTKYTVIMDSDCVLLMRGWDKYMINQMKNKIQIVGSAEIEDVNVNRLGTSFVLPFLCMFNTKTYKSLNISCLPGDIKNGQDVCWEWEKKYKEKNFGCSKFIGKSTRRNNKIEFSDLVGVENYYTKDNKIIASHFGRGSSLGFAKYKSWYFKTIPYLSKILNNFYGQSQINKWIFKSKKIIEKSS